MIAFNPLSPLFGAETFDVDLSQPLSDADFQQLEQAFYAHQVLALRAQAHHARRSSPPSRGASVRRSRMSSTSSTTPKTRTS